MRLKHVRYFIGTLLLVYLGYFLAVGWWGYALLSAGVAYYYWQMTLQTKS